MAGSLIPSESLRNTLADMRLSAQRNADKLREIHGMSPESRLTIACPQPGDDDTALDCEPCDDSNGMPWICCCKIHCSGVRNPTVHCYNPDLWWDPVTERPASSIDRHRLLRVHLFDEKKARSAYESRDDDGVDNT